jgi:hypothetical protein
LALNSLSKGFDYIWVIRCDGASATSSVACKTADKASLKGVVPLIEVINPAVFHRLTYILRSKNCKVMVDIPLYLKEPENRYTKAVEELQRKFPDQATFFRSNRHLIDVPVVSAYHPLGSRDFNSEITNLKKVQPDFQRVAVRIKMPNYNIKDTTDVKNSFERLLSTMRNSDQLLIDVFDISGIEGQIDENLGYMSGISKNFGLDTFILNAFNPINMGHNYGPLFSNKYSLSGFGDFATEKRYQSLAGRGGKKIVRYYLWSKFILREIKRDHYSAAAEKLMSTKFWARHPNHISACSACNRVHNHDYNNGPIYWKQFRILHYIRSVTHETRQKYKNCNSEEELDPVGCDTL